MFCAVVYNNTYTVDGHTFKLVLAGGAEWAWRLERRFYKCLVFILHDLLPQDKGSGSKGLRSRRRAQNMESQIWNDTGERPQAIYIYIYCYRKIGIFEYKLYYIYIYI